MCPRTYYGGRWKSGDMDMSTYLRISEAFPYTRYIHLQGWGEPMIHEKIFEMIEIGKEKGCRVGFTTNGMLLNEDNCKRLIELDLDLLGVSVDGATKETYERIRKGASFDRLMGNIETLVELRDSSKKNKPRIVFSLVKMEGNIAELPLLVDLAHRYQIEKVVATNLDCSNRASDERNKVISRKRNPFHEKIVDEAEKKADKYGIEFYSYPLLLDETTPVCGSHPLETLCITWDGSISPCVNLSLPVDVIHRMFCGEEFELNPLFFGNVNEESLLDIWGKEGYMEFREKFALREKVGEPHNIFADFFNLKKGMGKTELFRKQMEKHPPPDVCKTCYKRYGV